MKDKVEISENMKRHIEWLGDSPIAFFDGKTAKQVLEEGRVEELVRYVKGLELGYIND